MGGSTNRCKWGVIGGMGPLASAEFLRTVYRLSAFQPEQEMPVIIVDSDPSCPDRTEALEAGNQDYLLHHTKKKIDHLLGYGADRIVICCITMHCILHQLPRYQTDRIRSLVDLIIEELKSRQERCLLVCTNGTRASRVFENHPDWKTVKDHVVMPDTLDQESFHSLLYQIKRGVPAHAALSTLTALHQKYGSISLIAGCTEMHILLEAAWEGSSDFFCHAHIDPLHLLAEEIANSYQHHYAAT